MELVSADSLLAAGDEENDLQHDVEGDMASFEDRSDRHPEWFAAIAALVEVDAYACGFALQLGAVPDDPSLGADLALGP